LCLENKNQLQVRLAAGTQSALSQSLKMNSMRASVAIEFNPASRKCYSERPLVGANLIRQVKKMLPLNSLNFIFSSLEVA
jgi:hypothetical protein